jgi:hypothetical protein
MDANVNIAERVNKSCIEAVTECPQHREFEFDCDELVNGRSVNVNKLHKKGIGAVISYWNNKDTIGGSLLWEYSYCECLPQDVQSIFERVDDVIASAIEKEFGE